MNIENEQTTARVSRLFEQIRRYFALQKEYLSLNGVEMLTRLFTAIVLAVILILVGFLVILFGCFALAYWIGTLLDSTVLGFAIIAGVMLLVALLVWANRMSWIVQPTTRFMIGLFATKVVTPTLEGVMTVKESTSQQIEAQEQEMRETANAIFTPAAAAQNRWEMATNLLHNGMTIFRGVQIGLSVVSAARAVFGLGRKRRR